MSRVDSIEKEIANVEGFKVKFCYADGRDVRGDKEERSYPYQKAAWNEIRVAQWREQRFKQVYPEYGVMVLLADGAHAHGVTKLVTVRESYREDQSQLRAVSQASAGESSAEPSFVHESSESRTTAVWVVRAGYWGDEEPIALENNVATIHWNELPDLSGVSKAELEDLYRKAAPNDNNPQVGMAVRQVWAFRSEIKKGDLVILPLVRMWHALAVGEVTGPYAYRTDLGKEVLHTLPVEWFIADLPRSRLDSDLSDALGLPPTVYRIKTPSEAEQHFRAAVRDDIDRKWKRVFKNPPALKARIVHRDGTHRVKLHVLPREGELLRLYPKGATKPLYFKVDYVVHNVSVKGHAHAVEVHVSEGDEEEVRALNKMLQLAREKAREKRATAAKPRGAEEVGP